MNTFKAFIIAMMMIVIAQANRSKSRLLLSQRKLKGKKGNGGNTESTRQKRMTPTQNRRASFKNDQSRMAREKEEREAREKAEEEAQKEAREEAREEAQKKAKEEAQKKAQEKAQDPSPNDEDQIKYAKIPTKEHLLHTKEKHFKAETKFIDFKVNQETGTWRFFPNGTEIAYYPEKPVVIGPYIEQFEHEKVPLVYLEDWDAGKVNAKKEAFDRSFAVLRRQVSGFVESWSGDEYAVLAFCETGKLWEAWARFDNDPEKVIRTKEQDDTTVGMMKIIFNEAKLGLSEEEIKYFAKKDDGLSQMIKEMSKGDTDLMFQMVRVINAEMPSHVKRCSKGTL